MAQAESITTAIRQLMSRGRPPQSTTPVRQAYTELIAALAGNVRHPIYAGANAEDLDGRADQLETAFGALHAYLNILIGDTAQKIPGGALDRPYLEKLFQDVSAEALTLIRDAAEEIREHQNWRAP
jgi:hypothetical protein